MLCTIWCHFYNLKNMKNTHGGVLLLVKKPATLLKVTLSPWVFFTFFKINKWYQMAQHITMYCNRDFDFFFQCSSKVFPKSWNINRDELDLKQRTALIILPMFQSFLFRDIWYKWLLHISANIYLFKVKNRNTRRKCEMFKVDNKNNRTTLMMSFWCLYNNSLQTGLLRGIWFAAVIIQKLIYSCGIWSPLVVYPGPIFQQTTLLKALIVISHIFLLFTL